MPELPDVQVFEEYLVGSPRQRTPARRGTSGGEGFGGERIRQWRAGRQPGDAVRITDRKPPSRKGRDVYVYFDNDQRGHAPGDARRLAVQLGE